MIYILTKMDQIIKLRIMKYHMQVHENFAIFSTLYQNHVH